jgi:hypothetical protein
VIYELESFVVSAYITPIIFVKMRLQLSKMHNSNGLYLNYLFCVFLIVRRQLSQKPKRVKVKVKVFTLEQAMKAQRGNRGIALLFI